MPYTYNPHIRSVNFGSTDRFYTDKNKKEFGNNTWMFREDLNWKNYTEFIISNFRNKDKVNIIQFAASDGSEAYSLVLSLLGNDKKKDVSKFFPVQAYDIDDYIVSKAQRGIISLSQDDIDNLSIHHIPIKKYFEHMIPSYIKPDNPLYKNFIEEYSTKVFGSRDSFIVSDNLKNKTKFKIGDMFEITPKIQDNSNTIIMCRNILGYFYDEPEKIKSFIDDINKVLKPGSVFVIGDLDTSLTHIDSYLNDKKFIRIMKNVYLKV